MTADILLDREGDLPAPNGVQVIESEVDFLRYSTSGQSLLIRGARLCAWAESFYALRGQPIRVVESPGAALRRAFPALSFEQARELTEKIGKENLSFEEISPIFILNACFPKDYTLWQSKPSPEHAGRWLLWLLEHNPTKAEAVILAKFASDVEQKTRDMAESVLYRTFTDAQAKAMLWRWLGAVKDPGLHLGEFPLPLPAKLLNDIKEVWMKRIIDTNGAFFGEMMSFPISLPLRQELACLTADYYLENTSQLTRSALQKLQPYLNSHILSSLEEHLQPSAPLPLPEDEPAVLIWFEHEYLPYRRWQSSFGDETARQVVVQHAQTFARWLLERYPRWLIDDSHLAFQKSARLTSATSDWLILCIILDGLPAWDAEDLAHDISKRISRLTLQQKEYCFTSIPTVTEFAKEALLKGVPPHLTPHSAPLGRILPDTLSPKNGLKDARPGETIFWRVAQPDRAYHFEHSDKRERQVRAELESILRAVEEIVHNLPDTVRLQVLLTSDHGRLMNPRSSRRLPVLPGAQAHGRVCWSKIKHSFSESGFAIDEQAGFVELFGERFGMNYDLRIAWGEESFRTTKGGSDPYPHGGLFPEEILVPWFTFIRDAESPKLDIVINGTGEAEMAGELTINIINQSKLALECLEVVLSQGAKATGIWTIAPLHKTHFTASLIPWPAKTDLANLTATMLLRQPNGATFTLEVIPSLEIKTLYERPDDLLKDLEL